MPTTADVTKDDKGNLIYRGQKFPGYNKPMKDSGNKQGKVLAKKGDQVKVVRFGDSSMADNQSVEANDAFYARFGGQAGMKDKFSPLYWSRSHLWPRGSLKGKGAKPFHTLNKAETMQPIIKATNDELMQSVEIYYLADTPDAHGQYASAATVRNACQNFNENLEKGNIKANFYHSKDEEGIAKSTDKFEIMKSWINEVESVVGDTVVPENAWLVQLQWLDKAAWEDRKKGTLAGVSFGGRGTVVKPQET